MKTVNYTKNIALAATAALCLGSLAATTRADESDFRVPARMVHFSELNLNTQAGAEVLYKRIRAAAEAVCGDVDSRRLVEAAGAKACVDQAVAASIRAVNSPRLTNAYNAHVGGAPTTISIASLR
jgi:UrcA family protein